MADRLTPILDAMVSRIASLGLRVAGNVLPVAKRKAATHRQKMDPAAMITVAKSGTPEDTTRRRVGLWQTAYVIDVVLHAPYTGPDDSISEYAAARDTLVDLLKQPPLFGAPDVFDMDARPADWLRPSGETSEWDWLSIQVTATVAHA